jgi:outer membrane receptor protein involved in Fe transport
LNYSLYINQDVEISDKINLNAGVRYDHFIFGYQDKLLGATYFSKTKKGIISPKLNISYSPDQKIKFYLNNGFGFHSNDTRVILNNDADKILPRVFGTDLGVIFKPNRSLIVKAAIWHLLSEQEFVYVGDAGIIEPSGKSRRIGIDVSARYQFNRWLFGDIDINLTKARSVGEQKGEDFIPLAPSFTSIGGITAKGKNGFSGSLRYRFIDSRPANETNTVQASGYLLADAILSYRIKQFEITLSSENIFNSEWREAQFDTESRLKNEVNPISEIHYTPGSPRNVKAGVTFHF